VGSTHPCGSNWPTPEPAPATGALLLGPLPGTATDQVPRAALAHRGGIDLQKFLVDGICIPRATTGNRPSERAGWRGGWCTSLT
jgi:hypothetical protein